MTKELKSKITIAANDYCALHKISQNEMSRQTGINAAYVSVMLKGDASFVGMTKDDGSTGKTEIADRWFLTLADFVGYEVTKNYWKTRMTPQFQTIIEALTAAKEHGATRMITGPSGCGKSMAIDKFIKQNPLNTYRIIINDYYRLNDVINELMKLLNIDLTTIGSMSKINSRSKKVRLDAVVSKLKEIRLQGGSPILVIDEGENMAIPMLKTIKALYDQLKDYCAIVLVGTHDMLDVMTRRPALYPLYRRFKAGHKQLARIDDTYSIFLTDIQDKALRKLLCQLCDNYGELHDYLEPAIREAALQEVPLTEQFFRIMYNMPKLG